MDYLKIACSTGAQKLFKTKRETVLLDETDYKDVAAVVLTNEETKFIDIIYDFAFEIPVFLITNDTANNTFDSSKVNRVYIQEHTDINQLSDEIEESATEYEEALLPPFFKALDNYVAHDHLAFDCPGHQGGNFFKKHPAGKYFYDFYGSNIFRSDICNADVELGDLLIHEGPPHESLKATAKIYNCDRTYYVMNGTSGSNTVAISALVTPGDFVLFDRNNHKSVYDAVLVKSGGRPIYLETARNPMGFIGGIDNHCFEEEYIRDEIKNKYPGEEKIKRPIRLAVIQLGTYDGTIYNARQVVDRIGHLCDYILFDSAWVGYEQFIPMMKNCSPLLLELGPDDPGILVTQSVHKQQAGFSQVSYIHKKDGHIRGQKRYVNHKRFNYVYRSFVSTSPNYPLYASLDINARMMAGRAGQKLWDDCIKLGIEVRKDVFTKCKMIKPFIPPIVDGRPWHEYDTETMSKDIRFFSMEPDAKWHSFDGYAENQYFVDPNKFMLITPGIDVETGNYEDFGVPASILMNYLRTQKIIPEKNDFYSILFLLTPAEDKEKLDAVVDSLVLFEEHITNDSLLSDVLPDLVAVYKDRYKDYTVRQLCQEMHDFYKSSNTKKLQKELFRKDFFPETVMKATDASIALLRNHAKLVKLRDAKGEIALEGALPYPPGIFCMVPGEKWTDTVQKYFMILQEGINRFPGFAPEIHGVYLEEENGKTEVYCYVYDEQEDFES